MMSRCSRVTVIGVEPAIADRLAERLRGAPGIERCQTGSVEPGDADALVYVPAQSVPDLAAAETTFRKFAGSRIHTVVLVSSAKVYGAYAHNPGLIIESRANGTGANRVQQGWLDLEQLGKRYFSGGTRLIVLRAVTIPVRGGADVVNRTIQRRFSYALPGHDPGLQLLSPDDLARAVACALEKGETGVYNVAPDQVITLRHAIRLTGGSRIPIPRTLQRAATPAGQLEYIRYSWTVSNQRIKRELGFQPAKSSRQALADCIGVPDREPAQEYDPFGMDKAYIDAYGRTLFRFLHNRYWRIEEEGLENLPRSGRAVLVGTHRGFMPFDGVMALHSVVQTTGRYPRFLIHPGLVKFPFLFNFMRKLGGIIANQENADYVLERDEMLGIFPEGIRGAFTSYRHAHRVGKFMNDDFVKIALRHGAPVVPFVTVGSAEIFPILAKLDWGWWKRYTEWPAFPITPTFPFLPPFPLPAKWHTQWMPSIPAGLEYPPEAASDPAIVRAISREVRARMEEAMNRMLQQRKWIFFGTIFQGELG